MDAAVRRCGSRMRSFDWEHILPQSPGAPNTALHSNGRYSGRGINWLPRIPSPYARGRAGCQTPSL